MINSGAWLLLSLIFGGLILLVQRSERKRRNVSLIILAIVGLIVWQYALYRISGCTQVFQIACRAAEFGTAARIVAGNTVNLSILTAVLLNGAYWVLFGRSNPPASSDDIQVFGMNE